MIVATIHMANNTPIEDYKIYCDDDFVAVEDAAREVARNGTACYIHWWRDADGQSAFWGPRGASFEAQWYLPQ